MTLGGTVEEKEIPVFTIPDLRSMFPRNDRTPTDHYRFNAGKWMSVARLDPYDEKDRHAFRDAVLKAMPQDWLNKEHMRPLICVIRAWNPSLASIERTRGQDAKFSLFSGPPVPPVPPMTKRERDLTREIISSAMQLHEKRKGE